MVQTRRSALAPSLLLAALASALWGGRRAFTAGPAEAAPRHEAALATGAGAAALAAPARGLPRSALTARRAEEEGEAAAAPKPGAGKKLLVLGGTGYVGSEVCKLAVERGYTVTAVSRRGENPDPNDERLAAVNWVKGDASQPSTVQSLVGEADAVVHAIGLLFDVNSGLDNLNIIVSGSGSVPDEKSTYDTVTRQTAFNLIEAVRSKLRFPWDNKPTPVLFVSAAEAGWPEVTLGPEVEQYLAPGWLKEYLAAKRAVEENIASTPSSIRHVIFRPSLIWSWTKFDVLPIIPIFNFLSFIGVPFVDKTVTVNTLASAIIAGLEDESVTGVQRFPQMEELEKQLA